jgi:hypothetical protein
VRITPVAPDEGPAQTPYVFYDANFEPGTSAPLLQCAASNWPTGAVQAQIDVWCSYAMSRPSATIELADVADVAPPTAAGFPAPVEGVFYRVRLRRRSDASQPLQLSVVEQHTAGSDGLDALKLQCHPAPDRIVHLFDAENRLVVHTFYYNHGTPEPSQLRLTSRTAAQDGALRLRAPLEMEIFDNRDTVELSLPR